jgi:hypothetical protein
MPCPGGGKLMKRRTKVGGKASESARHKSATLKRGHTPPKAVPSRRSAMTSQETEIARLTSERDEALEREKATGQVLRVISSSLGQPEPVFRAMLEDAVRILEAKFGVLFLCEGDLVRPVAGVGLPPKLRKFQAQRGAYVPPPGLPLARLIHTKKVVQMLDDPEGLSPATKLGGARSHLAVPMLKEGKVIGAIYIYRQEVKPFADRQIELVSNFAAQAVIAIENARLLNELRQRTDDLSQRTTDLTEALEQQTATSEVLQVISRSPGDLEPVFASMLENAVRICDAAFGNIYRWDGEALNIVASLNTPAAFAEARRKSAFRPGPKNPVRQMIASKSVIHIPDVLASEAYAERDPVTVQGVEIAGIRTFLAAPC